MQETRRLNSWAALCLLNLLLVSVLGLLLRYKGTFSFPVVNYKYLLNAHSHFAFSGWVTTALFTALVYILARSGIGLSPVYHYQFWLNQVASFGMLVSFMWQGYGPVSIFFSAISVVFSYWFAARYWSDMRKSVMAAVVKVCIRLALIFLVLSSAGPFLLAYSMSHRVGSLAFYYNSIYLYLHFQYNGWFTFAVLGLLLWVLQPPAVHAGKTAWAVGLMGVACVPAYCLSLLWTVPPTWVWVTAGIAAIVQLAALLLLTDLLWKMFVTSRGRPRRLAAALWGLSFTAFGIKIILQASSVIPSLGRFAFSFRPVIIAYLHLVLLGFVTFFLLGFFCINKMLDFSRGVGRTGIGLFSAGVVGNEMILLLQSLLAAGGTAWNGASYYLFGAALCMFAGLTMLVVRPAKIV